jgi:hypothetical protein
VAPLDVLRPAEVPLNPQHQRRELLQRRLPDRRDRGVRPAVAADPRRQDSAITPAHAELVGIDLSTDQRITEPRCGVNHQFIRPGHRVHRKRHARCGGWHHHLNQDAGAHLALRDLPRLPVRDRLCRMHRSPAGQHGVAHPLALDVQERLMNPRKRVPGAVFADAR